MHEKAGICCTCWPAVLQCSIALYLQPCAADVLGRPVVVASHRMGLVEGQLHVVPPEVGMLFDGLIWHAFISCSLAVLQCNSELRLQKVWQGLV